MNNRLPILFNSRHILPAGRIPLRVISGLPLNTLIYAMKHNLELGVCMEETKTNGTVIGTRVSVEDFNLSTEDKVLTVTVAGKASFVIDEMHEQNEGIITASFHTLPSWPAREVNVDSAPLAERLESMFERYPELCSLYTKPHFDNLTWLCQRWLELLPLPTCEKQLLMATNSCNDTAEYLLSLMKEPH